MVFCVQIKTSCMDLFSFWFICFLIILREQCDQCILGLFSIRHIHIAHVRHQREMDHDNPHGLLSQPGL
jgi:hypothetical protein